MLETAIISDGRELRRKNQRCNATPAATSAKKSAKTKYLICRAMAMLLKPCTRVSFPLQADKLTNCTLFASTNGNPYSNCACFYLELKTVFTCSTKERVLCLTPVLTANYYSRNPCGKCPWISNCRSPSCSRRDFFEVSYSYYE